MYNELHLKDGPAAFYIYDDKLSHDSDNEFLLWLKDKGFKSEGHGHQNAEHRKLREDERYCTGCMKAGHVGDTCVCGGVYTRATPIC